LRRLLIRPGATGDFLVSLPALECLCADYTEVWAAVRNLPLARFAARTRSIHAAGLDMLGLPEVEPPARLIQELRGFDCIISWYGSNRPEFQEAVRRLGLPFRFLPALPARGPSRHAADFYMQQAGSIGVRTKDAVPRLDCPRQDEGFAAIHPFSGSPKKNWPVDRFKGLTELLAPHMPVRWIQEPGSPGIAGVEMEPPRKDLYELACRLACARIYVGNDSGITHLAAAAGTRVVALFGPTDPAVWAPRGENVRIIVTPDRALGMDSIPPEAVAAAVLQWASRPGLDSGLRATG